MRATPIFAAVTLAASSAAASDFYIPFTIAPFGNGGLRASFPLGSQTLGDVPFRLDNAAWLAVNAPGANPRTLTVPINVHGVTAIHTLINCDWGQAGTPVLARVEVTGSAGAFASFDLVGGFNIRDWNNGAYVNTLSSPDAVNVAASGTARIDKQRFALPTAFATQDLLSVRFIDTGADNVQRIIVQGLTAVTQAPAPRSWSTGPGANGHRYLAVQSPSGIGWAEASAAAEAQGGYLATITSAAENAFVYSLVGGNQAFWFTDGPGNGIGPWLGGVQPEGSAEPTAGWSWVTGEPFTYSNWGNGEPNNANGGIENRVQFFGYQVPAADNWNDYPAAYITHGYIIEWDSCPADLGVQGGVAGHDGLLDNNDFVVFIDYFFNHHPLADVGVQGGVPGADNQWDNNDFIVFIDQFFGGC